MLRFIAKLIAPDVFRDAQAYKRVWLTLDDARWWLGSTNPEAASLAQYVIERDEWYWSRPESRRDMNFCPPKWVVSIDSYRAWLATKPFDAEALPSAPEGGS